jgi:hypothetical protein
MATWAQLDEAGFEVRGVDGQEFPRIMPCSA